MIYIDTVYEITKTENDKTTVVRYERTNKKAVLFLHRARDHVRYSKRTYVMDEYETFLKVDATEYDPEYSYEIKMVSISPKIILKMILQKFI